MRGPNIPNTPDTKHDRIKNLAIRISGILLIGLFYYLYSISGKFSIDTPYIEQPILKLVFILITAALIYLITLYAVGKKHLTQKQLLWILFVGLALRGLMIITPPILEDDYYRYLWDGAVTANRLNPYAYSPKQVMNNEHVPPQLHELAGNGEDVITHINHPTLRTIYPPLAQAVFALSYKLGSWSVLTWKLILFVFGAATLWLLYLSLKMLKLPYAYLTIYWWNPLLVKEIYNSGHLDVLVFPLVVGGFLLAVRSSYIKSVISLVLGIGVKIWPVFLLPLIIRPLLSQPRKLIVAIPLIGAMLILMFTPIYLSGIDHTSGFIAYGQSWQNNDSIFRGIIYISSAILEFLGYETFHKYITARFLAATILGSWILYTSYRKSHNGMELFRRGLMIMAFAFLISPTQYPWYYTWLLPFLTIIPRYSLLILTALLPLYYLRYYLEPRGHLEIFTNYIVWIEFVPVWIMLFWEWKRSKLTRAR